VKRPLPLAILSATGLTPTQTLVEAAVSAPPSAGTVGRTELLYHWARMTHGQRRMLLKAAREITGTAKIGDRD
jgi:hypothetical protein